VGWSTFSRGDVDGELLDVLGRRSGDAGVVEDGADEVRSGEQADLAETKGTTLTVLLSSACSPRAAARSV
jgi:hypothetical protein